MKIQLEAAYKQSAKEDYESYKEWEDTLKDGIYEFAFILPAAPAWLPFH